MISSHLGDAPCLHEPFASDTDNVAGEMLAQHVQHLLLGEVSGVQLELQRQGRGKN